MKNIYELSLANKESSALYFACTLIFDTEMLVKH